ncbi:MAG TPA: hypothetical protein VNO14_16825 [Blastocatellia bacterium]|nr:hypothetical protein [Blastocatellia bacterium]
MIVNHLARKYGANTPLVSRASKVILVVDSARRPDWAGTMREVEAVIRPELKLEVWDEEHLLSLVHERFGVRLESVFEENVVEMRAALTAGKGRYAFGEVWSNDFLQQSPLWHFGFWRLKQLRERHNLSPRAIMPPGNYKRVAVLMADLCSFSSFVRDTRNDEVVRNCLTMFYSKARYEILNTGGMLYQFVGDEVIGLYGLPDRPSNYIESALECARSHRPWQFGIQRVAAPDRQATGGDGRPRRDVARRHSDSLDAAVRPRAPRRDRGRDKHGGQAALARRPGPDNRQQQVLPEPLAPVPGRFRGDRPDRCPKHRPHQSLEAQPVRSNRTA